MENTETTKTLAEVIAANNITMQAEFVPFSKSRSKDNKDDRGNPRLSLNWKVTLLLNGRAFITTDYMAGTGHCPADKRKFKDATPYESRNYKAALIDFEVENGFEAAIKNLSFGRVLNIGKRSLWDHENQKNKYFPILPEIESVVHSLITDSDVLNYSSFAEWADCFGYNTDSIKDNEIYRACMEIALKMRAGLGGSLMEELQTAAQDY